ncbi:MAG: type VI secretion system membrane subunit TssM [Rhodobacteraceae bacterium]|nr:type VI secretion system membrane subunit TssM [Paracoccaceae bacterium]
MMRFIVYKIFRNRTLMFLVFTTIICVAIFFAGPLLQLGSWRPFDSIMQRVLWIVGLFLFTIFLLIFLSWRRRVREAKMGEEMVAEDDDDSDDVVKEELKEMRGRMKEALKILRKSKLGGKSVYQLPWYVMIGPPGAGKTTAIINSGLNFPLAKKMGMQALGGVGGTRNCDWWFTDEAVLIDTAGRYTTQDSDEEADSAAWFGFLKMLRKNRKRQPINGAIVAISLSDLSTQNAAQRKAHAASIKQRLGELRDKLGVRFPVYVLFTKADLIAGFAEFYENLGREDREQVWGFTFKLKNPKAKKRPDPLKAFDEQFLALLNQTNNLSLERLQQETDPQRRGLISGFAQQVASLQVTAREFLTEVFQENKFEQQQLLRGIYFTSGTQEGTPIDRLMMGMARTFGIGRQAIGTGQGQGRSYFLKRLMEGVIFKESGLVSAHDKVARRYKWFVRTSVTLAILGAAGIGGLWAISYLGNEKLIASAATRIDLFEELAEPVPISPISDINLAQIAAPLTILRTLPGNPEQGDIEPPRALTYGLYQGDEIGSEAIQTYRQALNQMMLPRLLLKLERQMQANLNNPNLLFEALKVYMMLGLQGPLDESLVVEWMRADWDITYAGEANAQLREDLQGHLVSMINQPMREIALHGPLVEQVQTLLNETPVSQRIYNSIIAGPNARDLPDWRILDAGGPLTSRVLIRPSGAPMSEGVEGIYTKNGFYAVFLPSALNVAEQLKNENWVLGDRAEDLSDPNALSRIGEDVLDLYFTDYIAAYENVLGDIDVVPMGDMVAVISVLNDLSGPSSPIKKILLSIENETRLTVRDQPLELEGAANEAKNFAARELFDAQGLRTQALIGILQSSAIATGQAPPPPPGTVVETRFKWLREFVLPIDEGAPSALDGVMEGLTGLYQELNRLSVLGNTASLTQNASTNLQVLLGRTPDPMKRWITQVTSSSAGVAAGGARSNLNATWQRVVLPTCNRGVNNMYPFFKSQPADISIQEFSRLFAPQGLIDSFFQDNLQEFVDTSSSPWRWRRIQNQELGISDAVLAQFERASQIRDAFFLTPGLPVVSFSLKPIALGDGVRRVQLAVDGQILDYRNGQALQDTPMQWPGPGGPTQIVLQPNRRNAENSRSAEGAWAFFRLLDASEVRGGNDSAQSRVVFNIGGRFAVFQLRAGAAYNPFQLSALRAFRCPSSL